MKKATDYNIVSAADENELSNLVTNMLKNGWQPQGGISVTRGIDSDGCPIFSYFQAMVLPEM